MTIETALGLGALASVLAGIIKKIPNFPDGYGGLVAVGLNVVIYGVLQFGGVLGWDLPKVDNAAGILAQLAAMLFPFILSLVGSVLAHKTARALLPVGWLPPFLRRKPLASRPK